MTDNLFAAEKPWGMGGEILTVGDHIVEILTVEPGDSSGGYPQIEVNVGNGEGEIRNWIVVMPQSIGKVGQLIEAAGIPIPTTDQYKEEGRGIRIDPAYLAQLVGKKVGVRVYQEPDRQDPTRMRDRVRGYMPVSEVTVRSDVTPDNAFERTAAAFPGSFTVNDDDDIPF